MRTKATRAQEILFVVESNLNELNDVNVSTAFSRLGKMAKQREFPGDLTGDEAFRGLLRRARDFALKGRFPARNLAKVFHAIATLCATRRLDVPDDTVEETWAALDGAAVQAAPDMNSQDVGNALWAYATLGKMPERKSWEALEGAAARVAPDMEPQHLSNALWAHAKHICSIYPFPS